MLTLRKPSVDSIRHQIVAQATREFTYPHVGETKSEAIAAHSPAGYSLDHTRVRLGSGEAAFHAAAQALREWRQFRLGWLDALPHDTPLETGAVVAVVARAFGLWSVNIARIVYTTDDEVGAVHRFGFAYGTLPNHVEAGEERFLIEWDRRDENVYYDILALSRPRHLLARLGGPLVRRMQHRFGRESAASMIRAVQGYDPPTAIAIQRTSAST
jgi:uncharacterized protein (UPF0548 family)